MKKLFVLLGFLVWGTVAAATAGWENSTPAAVNPEKMLWREDFSGGKSGLKIEFRNGAQGSVDIVASPVTPGKKALKIIKSNQQGYILVTSKRPFQSSPGTELQSVIHVHGRRANPEYAVGYVRMYGKTEDLAYFKKLDGRGPGGPKMQYITNSPANSTERKLAHLLVTAETGNVITPALVVAGTPSESFWENWYVEDFTSAKAAFAGRITASGNRFPAGVPVDEKEFRAMLQRDIQHTAEVKSVNGLTRLLVDGKITAPVFFIPWAGKAGRESVNSREMQQSGVDMQFVIIQFGANPKRPGFWTENGFDVAGAVAKVRHAMRCAPDAKFLLTLTINPYAGFYQKYPSEVWKMADGSTVYGHGTHIPNPQPSKIDPSRYWPWISIHSEIWRNEVKKHLAALVAALQAEQLDKRIIGVHFTGFHDNQFGTRQLDYSIPAAAGFRKFLRQKYGTIENLQAAWQNHAPKSFEEVMPGQFGKKLFLSPAKEPHLIDWFYFQKTGAMALQEDLGGFIKACFGKKIIVIRYCMGAFGATLNCAYDVGYFLNCKNVDALIVQPSYSRRTPGLSIGLRAPVASFHHHGKLFVNDFDLRTYAALSGKESELRVLGLSCALNDTMWNSIIHKMAGQMIANNMAYRYLDMANGWFSPPEIMKSIREVTRFHQQNVSDRVPHSVATAAIVIDEAGMMLRNFPAHYYNYGENFNLGGQLQTLAASGVPLDSWLLDDLLKNPQLAEKYRVLIFAGMNRIDKERKEFLKRLQSGNRTLIYLSGTGQMAGSSFTGFKIVRHKSPADHEVIPAAGETLNMLSILHSETVLAKNIASIPAKNFRPVRFSVSETPAVKVHARYQSDGLPAIVSRQYPAYRSVYIGNPGGLTPEFFHHLVTQAGGFAASKSGLQIDMNDCFMSVHCIIPGRYTINLPRRCKVVNLKDNSAVPVAGNTFTADFVAGSSYWFELK